MSEPRPNLFHLISYERWKAGGATRCCDTPVRELPETDGCGDSYALRDPEEVRCCEYMVLPEETAPAEQGEAN